VPNYDYHCGKCGATYELRQGFDAETTHKCEECGRGIAKRVLTAPRVVFKGSGWYVTDSRKSAASVSDGSSSEGGSPDGASTEGGSEGGKEPKKETTKEPKKESTPASAEKSETKPAAAAKSDAPAT
jgi:putative FmdB family regulatory protein